jgi:hypothetical protein
MSTSRPVSAASPRHRLVDGGNLNESHNPLALPGFVPPEFLYRLEDGPPDFRPVQVAFIEEVIRPCRRFERRIVAFSP